ncbi:hypothetical protein M433DRAFT_150781 [Acidomyces richmondensis BFW]|nr:hypothetical protein M433DRAFT_150781 [Acidomyces richmondensis BFW]
MGHRNPPRKLCSCSNQTGNPEGWRVSRPLNTPPRLLQGHDEILGPHVFKCRWPWARMLDRFSRCASSRLAVMIFSCSLFLLVAGFGFSYGLDERYGSAFEERQIPVT